MKLSAQEQRLLDFARKQFGEKLTEFLLAGLGEDAAAQRRHFTITYAGEGRSFLKRRVELISYEPENGLSFLPCRRDPLVLLALIQLLLRSDHKPTNNLQYTHGEVLSLLGWKDTTKVRREIDQALMRYFMLTYTWKMNKIELACRRLSFYTSDESLISEINTIGEENNNSGQVKGIISRIKFNEKFIEQLLSRSLFGISWNHVQSVSGKWIVIG
jgi:hypothetical protein